MDEEESIVCSAFIHKANELAQEHGVDDFTIMEGMMGALAAYAHHAITIKQQGMWTPYDHDQIVKRFDRSLRELLKERKQKTATAH